MTGGIVVSDDPARIDFEVVHGFLSRDAYWCAGIPAETLRRAMTNSLVFGAYQGDAQVGFARVVTDCATFANLVDVFVLPPWRGQGVGLRLVQAAIGHNDVRGVRRFTLATKDQHALYARAGFTPLAAPALFMERHRPDVYAQQ